MPTRDDGPATVARLLARGPQDGADVVVRGFLLRAAGATVLCDALAETHPPQPGGASVALDGVDVAQLEAVSRAGADVWTVSPRTVAGTWRAGRLDVALVEEPG